jgi:predicted nucleotidyltransferase
MGDRSNVILNGIVGSTAYRMNTPTSDKDEMGIYVAPLDEVLGLNGPQTVTDSLHKTDPDFTLHEVGKYVSLALKCNPSILELLWLDDYLTLSPTGELLVRSRSHFLNTPSILGAYGQYAKAQADRLIRRQGEGKDGFSSDVKNRTAKHARHCMRLLHQGTELLATGSMSVRVSPEVRYELFAAGELAEADPFFFYEDYFKPKYAAFQNVKSVVSGHIDRDYANWLLVKIRRANP